MNIKEIKGYDDYTIDTYGRVYSLRFEKYLKGTINGGYSQVGLTYNKKMKLYSIHRLVAEAFIPNPNNKPFVHYINGIRTDNHIENLEWVTQTENFQYEVKRRFSILAKSNTINPKI